MITLSLDIKSQKYINERIENQIEYYDKSSLKCQKRFKILYVVLIITTSIIPILSLLDFFSFQDILIAVVGTVSSILSSFLLFFRHKENWAQFRGTCEKLKSELYKYQSKSEKYFSISDNDAFNLFVTTCEGIIGNQNEQWIKETLSINSTNSSS